MSRALQAIAKGVGRTHPYTLVRGRGSRVETACGRQLLDFTCGIGVTNTGHCHPRVVEAAQKQVSEIVHAQVNVGVHEPMLELVDELSASMPHPSLDTFYFCTTGAEAVENAVKLARHATGRSNVIVFQGGYHGRSALTMGMTTSSTIYSAGFGPFPSGIKVCPFPYELHGVSVEYCLEQLDLLLRQQCAPRDVAAMVLEPVLGEGGYVPCPPEFMLGVRKICDEHGILLVCDEVQTGFGRTGKLFAVEHHELARDYSSSKGGDGVADILVMAKGLASGFPLAAIASRRELMDTQPPGSMGGTYAGNAIACAAAVATQRVIREEKLVENADAMGTLLRARLHAIDTRWGPDGDAVVRDVRGMGCMVGLELHERFAPSSAKTLAQACGARGLLLLNCSVYETVRFIPPLTVSEDEIEEAAELFARTLDEIVRPPARAGDRPTMSMSS